MVMVSFILFGMLNTIELLIGCLWISTSQKVISGADTMHKMYKKAHEILSKKMVSRMVYIYLLEAYASAKCD